MVRKTCEFIFTFNVGIRKICLIILIFAYMEIFYLYKKQILNVLIHMCMVVSNLWIYSVKANFFFPYFIRLCGMPSATRNTIFKMRSPNIESWFLFVLCKLNICCIKKLVSDSIVLSQLSIKYQRRYALFRTIIIYEGFFLVIMLRKIIFGIVDVIQIEVWTFIRWGISNTLIYQSAKSEIAVILFWRVYIYNGTNWWNKQARSVQQGLGN